jgi:hypothetical protein
MDTNFQDFINKYRVEEFIERLKNDQNNHFTLWELPQMSVLILSLLLMLYSRSTKA